MLDAELLRVNIYDTMRRCDLIFAGMTTPVLEAADDAQLCSKTQKCHICRNTCIVHCNTGLCIQRTRISVGVARVRLACLTTSILESKF